MMYRTKDFENITGYNLTYPTGTKGTFELTTDLPLFSDVDKEFEGS